MRNLLVVIAIASVCGNATRSGAEQDEFSFEQLADSLQQLGLSDTVSRAQKKQGSPSVKQLFQKLDHDGNEKLDRGELARARRISQEIQESRGAFRF